MAASNLTEKEKAFIKKLVDHNEYGERGRLDNHPWSWAVCGTKAQGAILGSLVTKGLACQDGRGKDASCYLTEAGKIAYLEAFGADGINPDTFPESGGHQIPTKADILGDIFFDPKR